MTSVDDIDAIFDRARARNRTAQLRLRQRLQAELDSAQGRLDEVQQCLAAARERYVVLQRQRVELSTRSADAARALAAVHAQRPRPAPAAAPAAAAVTQTSARLGGTSLQPSVPGVPIEPRSGHGSTPDEQGSHHTTPLTTSGHSTGGPAPALGPSSVLTYTPKRRTPFALQQPRIQPPRPIAAFDRVASISYDDLRAVTDPGARFVNFSRHAVSDMVARVFASKAAQMGLPPTQVCWFVQTPYEVAAGSPMSASMTLSSQECIASFGLHYLMSRLEFMLISAATLRISRGPRRVITEIFRKGTAEQDEASSDSVVTTDVAPPAKTPRPPVPRFSTPAGGAHSSASPPAAAGSRTEAQSTDAAMHDSAQHAQRVPHPPTASAAVPADPSGHRAASASDSAEPCSVPTAGLPPWSRLVRCRVNETHDAACAVRHILHGLVRSCCREIPLPTLHRLLSSYHDALQRMLSSLSQPQGQGGGGGLEGVSEEMDKFKARGRAACGGVISMTADAIGEIADMQALRNFQVEGRRRSPVDVEGDDAEQQIEAQAHISVAGFALLHHLGLREAPHTVRSLSYYGVFPLARLDEIDSLHVHLYRGLRLTNEDRARLIMHWKMWSQVSTTLNTPFNSAVATLRSLPQPADIPAALIARVNDVAAGTCVVRKRSCGAGGVGRMHEHHACGGVRDGLRTAAGAAEEDEWGEGLQLLGSCAEVTAAAEAGLLELHSVHDMHGRVRRETMDLQMQPGVVLQPLQLMRVWSAHIPSGTAPADFMKLSQLAAAQQRWRDTALRPAVLQAPLPKYQWPEGSSVATGVSHCDRRASEV